MNRKLFATLILAIAAVAVLAACGGGGAQAVNLTVRGEDIKFSPTELTVKAGQTVNLTFENAGTLEHSLIIEAFNVSIEKVQAGQTGTATFTPTTAGTYEYHCDVAGHTEAGMVGTLTVTP